MVLRWRPVAKAATLGQVVLSVGMGAQDDGVATLHFGAEDVDTQDSAVTDGHLDIVLETDSGRRGRDLHRWCDDSSQSPYRVAPVWPLAGCRGARPTADERRTAKQQQCQRHRRQPPHLLSHAALSSPVDPINLCLLVTIARADLLYMGHAGMHIEQASMDHAAARRSEER